MSVKRLMYPISCGASNDGPPKRRVYCSTGVVQRGKEEYALRKKKRKSQKLSRKKNRKS